jgi:hypothetical protein
MNYTIDIIDTENNDLVLSIEKAIARSVILNWQGADRKDELNIIGSSLKFTMAADSRDDGVYYDLFTGDETRYRVRLYDDNDVTLWNGFLLPDQYSEPYSNKPILVDFQAADGLGRLKGKYLPEDYYNEEKSVIDIIATCLSLTGVDIDFRFSPAIENSSQKDYDKIYINTKEYKEDSKQDAFKILEELFESMLCVCYQADNCWNVEGLNIREQRVYDCKVYNYSAELLDTIKVTRLIKDTTNIATPNITMQPPIGKLTVSKESELFELPEGLSDEENDGWSYKTSGVVTPDSVSESETESLIYASDWFGVGGFKAYSGIDDKVFFGSYSGLSSQTSQSLNLNYTPYVLAGERYKLKYSFTIVPISEDEDVNKDHVDNKDWQNPFLHTAYYYSSEQGSLLNGYQALRSNSGGENEPYYLPLNFGLGDNKTIEIELDFIPAFSGVFYFQIRPLEPGRGIEKVIIDDLKLDLIGDEEEEEITGTVAEDWTTTKEIELEYGAGVNGLGKTFRLSKLNDVLETYTVESDIIREFDYKGKHYVSVNLYTANLVDENRDGVVRPTSLDPNVTIPVAVEDVIYNYHNSDEHVIITEEPVFTKLLIDTYKRGYRGGRDHWIEWTDAVYGVERIDYMQAVYNVSSRLSDKEIPSILNLTVKNNVKFNDFIRFIYRDYNDWVITNCKWDIDKGFSDLSIASRYYISGGEYPPIVQTENIIYTNNNYVILNCEAKDVDGFIVSYKWEELTNTGAYISFTTIKNPYIFFPVDVYYLKYKITVTDNDGNTASDTVEIYKRNDSEITLEEIYSDEKSEFIEKHYKLNFAPEIEDNNVVIVNGRIRCFYQIIGVTDIETSSIIEQNGSIISNLNMNFATNRLSTGARAEYKYFSLNYIPGDDIVYKLKIHNRGGGNYAARVSAEISNAYYYEGFGNIQGAPFYEDIQLVKQL